jgi:penicillin G amidase
MISILRTFSRIAAMAAATLAVSASTPATTTSTVGPAGPPTETLVVEGLRQPVEILRDRWGIAHIYAQNEDDLFFAQGYNAARDRLFQFEVWRRQATGTVAQILGRRELRRDIGARLLRFRGDLHTELNHYHPRGEAIVNAFVRGVNAYIGETERDPSLLPLEFGLLGIKPQRWTPDVVISRHQGLVSNLTQELAIGRAVAAVGEKAVRDVYWFQPGSPDLTLDPILTRDALSADILELYSADRSSLRFRPEDLAAHTNPPSARPDGATGAADDAFAPLAEWNALLSGQPRPRVGSVPIDPWGWGGSNNWVVSGRLTASGMPIMANDPHRAQSAPSLRYYVHLVAPGWNVIGGGEPELPGVSIGHNEFGAWGLTVFGVDGEDLYVYQTNPSNPRQYRYAGGWEDMRVIRDTIPVEGESPVPVELEYTRHGPVLYRDSVRHLAFALRAAWLDVGASPYLASLRMDQARSWEEFRVACSYSRLPAENMVWADRDGNIGWQAVGGAPIRPNWSGLVPVPGDGRYEWQGYLPIPELPHVANPDKGWWATANNNLIPSGYAHRDAVAWTWSDPFRRDRIDEVLGSGRKHSVADMMRLQHDELAIPARMLVPLLRSAVPATNVGRQARDLLLDWDYVLDRNSVAAAVYVEWERQLSDAVEAVVIPKPVRDVTGSPQLSLVVQWLLTPDGRFGSDPIAARDRLLAESLDRAVVALRERLGTDMSSWKWGGPRNHHALIRNAMSGAVDAELRRKLDVGPAPRGGYGLTVNATGAGANQTSGASFRIITDLSDWDHAVGTNTPGQSGNPDDPHYADLFPLWAAGEYFPVFYTREKVESVTESRFQLVPSR